MPDQPSHAAVRRVLDAAERKGVALDITSFAESTHTAEEAAAAVGAELAQIVKSLVFVVDDRPTMVLCAGDRRVTEVDGRPASADEVRAATGFAIGGVPPLGHDADLPTIVDESLRRFDRVWCAAGTPHAVFETDVEALIGAIPGAAVRAV